MSNHKPRDPDTPHAALLVTLRDRPPKQPRPPRRNGHRLLFTLAGVASLLYGVAHLAIVPVAVGVVILLETWVFDEHD